MNRRIGTLVISPLIIHYSQKPSRTLPRNNTFYQQNIPIELNPPTISTQSHLDLELATTSVAKWNLMAHHITSSSSSSSKDITFGFTMLYYH
mmetsp:Transcript_27997/g.34073  ORF Transcript_27997/g.34073 Transcript_27997/m.34073 type:complete len:92 (-) Transcript_27997:163-438(-)